MTTVEAMRALIEAAKFGPLKCDNFFPSVIYEETPKGLSKAVEIRGWGWLQKQEDGDQVQDARGRLVLAALNALPALLTALEAFQYVAESASDQWSDDYLWKKWELSQKMDEAKAALAKLEGM